MLEMNPGAITYFPNYQAEYMRKHLADEIYNTKSSHLPSSEEEFKEIYSQIDIKNE